MFNIMCIKNLYEKYVNILDAIKNNSGFDLKADAYLQVSLKYLNEIENMLDDESEKEKIK